MRDREFDNEAAPDERRGRRGGRDRHRGSSTEPVASDRPEGGRGGGRRGPGGRGARRHGDIRRLLLAGLIEGPTNGYQLMKRLEEISDGRWRPSPGSVYPMLQQLEDEGLVAATETAGRKAYELTETGRSEADPAALEGLAAEVDENPGADLRAELEQLHLAVRQLRVAGGAEHAVEAAGVLRQARQTIYRLLGEA